MQIKKLCYNQIFGKYLIEKSKPAKRRKLIKFICDGCPAFKTAFNILFRRTAKLISGVPIACKKYNFKHNNNYIERYNREVKRRIIVMGTFQTIEGARTFCSLRRIIYNFVNSHSELNGKTPAEAADIFLSLGRNKLLNLIRISVKNSR